MLGRPHYSVLDTIKENISNPAFKRGNLMKRPYTSGTGGRWYEFLLTRRALEGLASIMRYGAKDKIAEARTYAELYANEERRRIRNGDMSGYWHDLYQDLLWRVVKGTDGTLSERMESHRAFKERISRN